MATTRGTRSIARAAVRSELSRVALECFLRDGFDHVTVTDVASAAGVSRTTFLRYFATKEDAVLGTFELRGEQVTQALRDRPRSEDDWTALRRAFDVVVVDHERDRTAALAIARLIAQTASLRAWELQQQCSWRTGLAAALADRSPGQGNVLTRSTVVVAAALNCLDIAVAHWAGNGGIVSLGDALDSAFAHLTTTD
ncbi:TetR family transcriptional regulator [Rhodococcus sp. 14-2470-1a]|uniref:TetR family transcriptional regulator n=1 Tax=Rhodococcus sp. 14-2470-1a TaxID=2023150 RepID=UPI000B9AAE1C|nr:TetR family transcriptional regulator [Rhodococcus sp. 14-2470-1a]OZF42045.1 TetR family transcriptional regulator [Rhodococcus sp. 14-2470-1a]